MIVLQGTTPEEVKNSVLELLEQEAARHVRSAKTARLKGEATQARARANALRNVWHLIKDCTLADLNAEALIRREIDLAIEARRESALVSKLIPGNPATQKSTDDTK